MLINLNARNQLTLPAVITRAVGEAKYFDVLVKDRQILLTPVRIQRADAVRAKLAELGIAKRNVVDSVDWVRARSAKYRGG
jgi:hypothetical protein